MSIHSVFTRGFRVLRSGGRRIARLVWRAWHTARRPAIPVEVLVMDCHRRRMFEREVRAGLASLQRTLGTPSNVEVAVVVQHVVQTIRQMAGCTQTGRRPDGKAFALIRLALQMDGQNLGADAVLAALAEAWIGLVTQQNGWSSVVVPLDVTPAVKPAEQPTAPLPLHLNGNGAQAPGKPREAARVSG